MIAELLPEVVVVVCIYLPWKVPISVTKSTQSKLLRQYNDKCIQPLNSAFANK